MAHHGGKEPDFYAPLNVDPLVGTSSPTFWLTPFGQSTDLYNFSDAKSTTPVVSQTGWQQLFPAVASISQSPTVPGILSPMQTLETGHPPSPLYPQPTTNIYEHQQYAPQQSYKARKSTREVETINPSSSGAVSEYSKRRDWAAQLVREIPDFLHALSPNGVFLFASPSIRDLAGYTSEELLGRLITDFLHNDDIPLFAASFNECTNSGRELLLYTRFRKKDGLYLILEITGRARYGDSRSDAQIISNLTGSTINSPSIAKCFFGTARPYPSKNTQMLDSYLEYKMDNEKLKAKAKELYDEAEAEGDFTSSPNTSSNGTAYDYSFDPYSSIAPSLSVDTAGSHNGHTRSATEPASATAETEPKKKRRRAHNEGGYMCHDCGTDDSPEWRKGPMGPKTLCNACGLRWAKKSKGVPVKGPRQPNKK